MAYTYAPSYKTGSTSGETAQETGLGTASNILKDTLTDKQYYPDDPSASMQGPVDTNISANVGYNPMGTVQGIGANGYQDLQDNLQAPIYRQGQQAQQNIQDAYGGRGLYGSVGGGLMSGAQSASQLATQDALSNAVASRYNLQLEDQAQQMDQNKALFSSGAATADQQNAYNQMLNQQNQQNAQQQIDFGNQQAQSAAQYLKDRNTWQNSADELNFQRALQLAGQGNSGAQVQAQIESAADAADAQQQAALYSGIGAIGGGLMGNYDSSGGSGWNFSDLKFW